MRLLKTTMSVQQTAGDFWGVLVPQQTGTGVSGRQLRAAATFPIGQSSHPFLPRTGLLHPRGEAYLGRAVPLQYGPSGIRQAAQTAGW